MSCRSFSLALGAITAGLALSPDSFAQRRAERPAAPPPRTSRSPSVSAPSSRSAGGPRTPIEEFETMPPAERQKALSRLPAGERKQLQDRLDRFHQLPVEQQQALINMYQRLHQLPPQRQEAVRKAWNNFSGQPRDRQQAIRDQLRDMVPMSADERKALIASPDFRHKFSRKEQDIVRDMEPLLPARE